MKERNCGIDIFRIMCCIGVLNFHIVDDVLGIGGRLGYIIFFMSSFCINGFFLLSGYLLGKKENLDFLYIESKIFNIMIKLFGWIVFWVIAHYIRTGELYGLWDHFMAGISSAGILPVSWFLFTYCGLLILSYFFYHFSRKFYYIFYGVTFLSLILLALGYGKNIVYTKVQSLWMHIYLSYFCVGIVLSQLKEKLGRENKRKLYIIVMILINISSSVIYVYKVLSAETFSFPDLYYGRWYYTLWLVSLFLIVLQIKIRGEKIQRIISRLASNTFVVYLGHLPILLYITELWPLKSVEMAVVYIFVFFVGLEILAEVFRKLPLLRKLV